MKTVTITIEEKERIIKPLPFRKVLEVLKYIKTLPEKVKDSLSGIDAKDIRNIKGLDQTLMIGVFADLISASSDEIIDIIAVASDLTSEEIGNLSIVDVTKLFKALLEVNEVEEIKKEFGELGEMFNKKPEKTKE